VNPSQLDLFSQQSFASIVQDVKKAMNEAIRASNLSREQVLDRMNTLALRQNVRLITGNGKTLKLETLNKWLNVEDDIRVPSLKALPIFCAATGSAEPLAVIAKLLGARLIDVEEIKLLEWAKRYRRAQTLRKEMKELEADLK
jgi:hypothetical protein